MRPKALPYVNVGEKNRCARMSDYRLGTPIDNAGQPTLEIGIGFYSIES